MLDYVTALPLLSSKNKVTTRDPGPEVGDSVHVPEDLVAHRSHEGEVRILLNVIDDGVTSVGAHRVLDVVDCASSLRCRFVSHSLSLLVYLSAWT